MGLFYGLTRSLAERRRGSPGLICLREYHINPSNFLRWVTLTATPFSLALQNGFACRRNARCRSVYAMLPHLDEKRLLPPFLSQNEDH